MVKSELQLVWIARDGNKFLSKKDAITHEEKLDKTVEFMEINFTENQLKEITEQERLWRQTKAKQRAIDLKEKLYKK